MVFKSFFVAEPDFGFTKIRTSVFTELMHTVCLANDNSQTESVDGRIEYFGPSPDEVTLTQAANDIFGFTRIEEKDGWVSVRSKNETRRFKIICQFPFTSDRKRMSVLVQKEGC